MEPNKILKSDFLDILFEERNKVYGAYELRRSYNKRITLALSITGLVIASIITTTVLATNNENDVVVSISPDIVIESYIEKEEVPKVIPPPPEVKIVEPPQIKMIDFVTPEVTIDELVTKTPPEQSDFEGVQIGDQDLEGIISDISIPPPSINIIDIIEAKKPDPDGIWIGPIEIEAEYIGGPKEWEKFLRRNLEPEVPIDNNAAPGRYTVYIQFIVDKEGNVSDMKPLTAHGFGMEQEAIRVLRKATKWKPANQNGRAVKAYRKQPITFVVADQ